MATITFLEPYTRSPSETTPPPYSGDLVQVLILSALRKIDQARRAHREDRPVEKGFYIGRATTVVDALRDTLDPGGSRAVQDLDQVCDHVDLCLQMAVREQVPDPLERAREAMAQLAACWQAADSPMSFLKGTA